MELIKGDCIEFMKRMVEEKRRVDLILTDPPYNYLKHRLDLPFDYEVFFDLASKITDRIIFFGRGDSFYEWNLIAAKKGFEFKEEIIWSKGYLSNPCGNLSRLHETISVRMKKGNSINKVFIDYIKNNLRLGNYHTLISMLDKMEYLTKRGDKYFLSVRRLIKLGKFIYNKKKGGGVLQNNNKH